MIFSRSEILRLKFSICCSVRLTHWERVVSICAHLIGVVIWGCNFHGRRQVEDDAIVTCASLTPSSLDGFTNLKRKLGLCLSECLWTILVSKSSTVLCGTLFRQLSDKLSVLNGEVDGLFFRVAKYNITEGRRCSIVHMEDGEFCTCNGVDCTSDQVLPGRSEDLAQHKFNTNCRATNKRWMDS